MSEAAAKAKKEGSQMPTFGRERLSPGAYTLDLSAVKDIVLRDGEQQSTFGEIYSKLRDMKIRKVPEVAINRGVYVTEQGEIVISAATEHWRVLGILRDLLGLVKDGIEPHSATWFYYDKDWSCDGDLSHSFFVSYQGKIVREIVGYGDDDPLILRKREEEKPVWQSEPDFDAAWEIYWYRKFYAETLQGQLMVLRPDEPILYHFQRPASRDAMRDVEFVTVVKTYHLLWVTVPLLAAIAFPAARDYMAIAAALLGVDLLWRCWATRKVGGN